MQTTGGGVSGPVGRKTKTAVKSLIRERDQQTVEAASRSGPREQGGLTAQQVHDISTLRNENKNGYTPLDFAKQVYQFPGKVYDDADQSVRGLIGMLGNIAEGQTPYDAGLNPAKMASETFHNWTNPIDYANEHPFGFMADVAGAGALGEAALSRAAAARGATIPEWLASEEGAIGRLGERLGSGEVPSNVEAIPGMKPSYDVTATSPGMSLVKYGNETDLGVFKPRTFVEEVTGIPGQAASEATASRLNAATGSRVRMPGMQEGVYPYQNPNLVSVDEFGPPPAPSDLPGTLMEYLPDVRRIETFENHPGLAAGWTDPTNPAWAETMRNQNIFDQAIGNVDRGYGQNMFEHEGLPIALDQGVSMNRPSFSPSMVEPRAWGGDWALREPQLEWIQQMMDQGPNIGATEGGLRGLLLRLKQMMDYREMPVGPNYEQGQRI